MKIGLIDVDSCNYPNIPLMKISSYHKKCNNNVEFVNPDTFYDIIYMSKIFTFTKDYDQPLKCNLLIKGGTGYNLDLKLSNKIEHQYPDYSLYNDNKIAYGFLTRGCPRNCGFCIVSDKEGLKSYKVADLTEFWSSQPHIEILDPNLLACNQHLELLDQLIKSKSYINFNQGLDCRFLNEKNIEKILSCKIKMLHFAWDNMKDENIIIHKLELFNKHNNLNIRKKRVYVLVNYNTTFDYDIYRIETLKKLGYDPYIMIYNKENCNSKYKRLQRYVNNKFIYYSKSFDNFFNYHDLTYKSKLEDL